MTERKTPPHMRDNLSDDEYDFADTSVSESETAHSGSTSSEAVSKDGKVAGGTMGKGGDVGVKMLERMLKRKAQVGEVEIDPQIGALSPPAFSLADNPRRKLIIDYTDFTEEGPGLSSRASMTDEGMINIWVDLKQSVPDLHKDYAVPVKEYGTDPSGGEDCPSLNIVIFIVGSRGDVQPYLSLALSMIHSHGHRVRIATHPDFMDFVLGVGKRLKGAKGKNGQDLEGRLEFFDIGGDPKALMAYMVKNPGLLPGWASLTNGDVGSKRKMTSTMLQGFYQSIYSPDPVTSRPFAADAIISNPPAFAHCHIAEAFGLPLHMTFTMPWSPSTAFNHPLVNIKQSNAEKGLTNVLTFSFADMMTWQGLGDIINAFRAFTLGLEPLSVRSGPSIMDRLKVPWTYCWSEGLIPKPEDWKEHIDISGFYFLQGDSDFKPDDELAKFLQEGEPPVYIGFGSVVVEDAAAMTQTIFDAVKEAEVRALVSAGWGGLGGTEIPDGVFILEGNVPHDWLFADGRVSAVCHHGGAGTTAIGLRNGLPTIVVPFFGDQKFWGEMIHRAAAGPEPIPHKELTAENLAGAIRYAVSKEAKVAAGQMGEKIRAENGEAKGVKSFHKHLPLKTMRCDLQPEKAGGWWYPQKFLRLSGAAGIVLEEAGKLKLDDLEPLRAKEYQPRWRSKDIKTEGTSAILMAVSSGAMSSMFDPAKGATTLATTMPQGVVDLFSGVHSGFDMIPGKIGSDVRERGKIDGLVSGVREAGKGLAYGWWDGITGLATEPIKGGQKEGALGVLKGMGRSYINVWARPAAGITGAFALPLQGAYLSMRQKVSGTPSRIIREPRIGLSHLEAAAMSPEEKHEIVKLFEQAEEHTDERRGYYKRKTEVYLQNMKKEKASSEKAGEEQAAEQEEGFLLKDGDDVGYIQEGELRQMSEQERDKMAERERKGYERAKKEFEDEHARHGAGI